MIVVQKGDEKWQVARDKGTKVTGDLKVGAKGDDSIPLLRHGC